MKKFAILLVLALSSSIAYAQDMRMYHLKNGQTVIVQENHNNPIVIIDTWVKTGSRDENDMNNGVAHFLEHLFFTGSENTPTGDFDKIIENKGGITNAATSKDFTHYYIEIPSKNFDTALKLHSDMMLHPVIPPSEMERERKVVLEEINKDLTSPQKMLYENLNSMMFKTHPYSRRVIGRSDVIENISRDKVFEFYKNHYNPSNMTTVVVGDVDTKKVLTQIENSFAGNSKKIKRSHYKKEALPTKQDRKVEYMPTEVGYMMIGYRGPSVNEKDLYAVDVLATILGEGKSSILNKELKEKNNLVNSISAASLTMRDDGVVYIDADFEANNTDEVEKSVYNEISKIQQEGVSDEQLSLAKNLIGRNTYYGRESISNIASEIGYTVTLTDNIKLYNTYLDNINKVTKEDVQRVAKKYLQKSKSAISIVLPQNMKNVQPVKEISYKNDSMLVSQTGNTKKYRLANNSTLLYSQNTSNDIIAITIQLKGGQLAENIGGTAKVTSSLMLKGTKKYNKLELAQFLEDNGIGIDTGAKGDTFYLKLLTTKDEYSKTMDILNELVNNATLDETELERVKKDTINNIKRNKDIPLKRALEEYRDLVYKDTPYSISSKVLEKNINKISQKDVINYYNKIFTPNNVIISVNGNVDENTLITDLNRIFNQRNDGVDFDYTKYNSKILKPSARRETVQYMDTETAWIFLGWQVNGVQNEKDFATMNVIDSLLGSGMSSRLFNDLRKEQGLAYQLGSGYSANILRGSFLMYIGTNPKTLEKAKQGLFTEIQKLKTQKVGEEELQNAKDKLLGNYVIGLEKNMDKAVETGWGELTVGDYTFTNKYQNLIENVTSEDIYKLANKYFDSNYILSIVTK